MDQVGADVEVDELNEPSEKKRSRENTTEEKKIMRKHRKKRKRLERKHLVKNLQKELEKEHKIVEQCQQRVVGYKRMARSFWERWQWELGQRKEALRLSMIQRCCVSLSTQAQPNVQLKEINLVMLTDPVMAETSAETKLYVGRGSFGIVKLQVFRGIKVAVKELLPRTNLMDVRHEAHVLSKLCHPFLPYLFGVCTVGQPYCIIMQFHGISDNTRTLTLSDAISKEIVVEEHVWLGLCGQLLEAFHYLHDEAGILHNDLKSNNILISDTVVAGSLNFQIIVIDFGKATGVDNGKQYNLTDPEKSEYTRKFPHMAPEVIDGITRQTKLSDMYSIGGVLYTIIDYFFDRMPVEHKQSLTDIAEKCRCPQFSKRISAQKALLYWQQQEL